MSLFASGEADRGWPQSVLLMAPTDEALDLVLTPWESRSSALS
jgi:hypothetical protein